MDEPVPAIGRTTFVIHVVVSLVTGLPLLVAPFAFGAMFGYPSEPGLQPVLRAFGAALLAFGTLLSWYAARAKAWSNIDLIVRADVAFALLATAVFVISALAGVGPRFGNWLFGCVTAIMFVLFAATFAARPKSTGGA